MPEQAVCWCILLKGSGFASLQLLAGPGATNRKPGLGMSLKTGLKQTITGSQGKPWLANIDVTMFEHDTQTRSL